MVNGVDQDEEGKDITTSVIRRHWRNDHGYTVRLFQWSDDDH